MSFTTDCMFCTIRKNYNEIVNEPSEEKKKEFLKFVMNIVLKADESLSPSDYVQDIDAEFMRIFGRQRGNDEEVKLIFNNELIPREETYWNLIWEQKDPLHAALLLSRAGNYIDSATVGNPDKTVLDKLLTGAVDEELNPEEYKNFKSEIEKANNFLLITDNAGEIVMDKLLVRTLKKLYPDLNITVMVRGVNVLNDASMEDAKLIGLTEVTRVIGNGNDIPGTRIEMLSAEAKKAVDEADLILAKGQGNVETMLGCGLNVYYLFLCKCDMFTKMFNVKKLSGCFLNERRNSVRLRG